MSKTNHQAFQEAVDVFGSGAEMARVLGESPQFVSDIRRGKRPMPATWAPRIERLTKEAGHPIYCEQLFPAVDWTYLRNTNPELTKEAADV